MKKTVLVTGGTGYIGSHTVVELQQAGYDVVVLDNLENSHLQVLDGIEKITGTRPPFYKVDLRDSREVDLFFKENERVEAVIHFAAYKAAGESTQKPLEYYFNNVTGMLHLLQSMKKYGVQKMVFSSSCTVYGEPDKLPVTEKSPTRFSPSPYGNTKRICEEVLSDVVRAEALQCISLRYFNPVGAHPSALIGELPLGVPNNLVPYITQTAAGKREKLTVYGSDYPTRDGTCVRDYIHVVDLAKAHVIALNRLLAGKNKKSLETFNLGTGEGYSVLDVVHAFEKATGKKVNYQVGPRREGDVTQIYADTQLANKELGWKAEESLESMMSSAWKWELNIPYLYGDKLNA